MGLMPNRKGQPLLVDWQVAVVRTAAPGPCSHFLICSPRIKLKADALANSATGYRHHEPAD